MEEILRKTGLTENEAKVYLSLLKMRSALAGEITVSTGIHRRTVYDAIERLIQKGLVSYVMHGTRKHFQAEEPERLLDIMKKDEEALAIAIPQMKAMYLSEKKKQEARIFKGTSGLKAVLEDQLAVGKEILVFGAYGDFDVVLKYYRNIFERKRREKKIPLRLIFDESNRGKPRSREMLQVKYLPHFWAGPVSTNIYGDKVAITLWSETPMIFLIENEEVAKSYKKHFESLWKNAVK